MEITHELLLSLGFAEVYQRTSRYVYKGFTGRLETNRFVFHGLSLPVQTLADLRYLMMMIDAQYESTVTPYPINLN